MNIELEWKEKWRPNCLADLAVDDNTMKSLQGFFAKDTFSSCTFAGLQGIGKPTIAKIIIKELKVVPLIINASINNNIDTVRGQINDFTESVAMDGAMKIVLLDEVDGFASEHAWRALRGHIEECSDDTRFILTCNFPERIPAPILSRCPVMNISSPQKKIFERLLYILKMENIKLSKVHKKHIIHIIKKLFPDIRAMVSHIELCCVTGEFIYIDPAEAQKSQDVIISYILENIKDPRKCRKYLIKNETKFEHDYIKLAGRLYDRFFEDFNADALLFIGDRICRMHQVSQPEIEFSSMIIELGNNL